MLNKLILQCRLCADTTVNQTSNGTPVANARVCWSFDAGEDNHETVFIDATIWGKRAEAFAEYVKKGDMVLLEGRLAQRVYTNKDGKQVTVTEMKVDNFEFLTAKKSEEPVQAEEPKPAPKNQYNNKKNYRR